MRAALLLRTLLPADVAVRVEAVRETEDAAEERLTLRGAAEAEALRTEDDEDRTARLLDTPEERAAPPRAPKPAFLTPGREAQCETPCGRGPAGQPPYQPTWNPGPYQPSQYQPG